MSKILAIDPGTRESAFVLMDKLDLLHYGIVGNDEMLQTIREPVKMRGANYAGIRAVVVEMVACYGMAVGKDVFETVWWIGRFCEAAPVHHRLYRSQVKAHLCGRSLAGMRAKDKDIRAVLIAKLGTGATKGVHSDIWAALAVGVVWQETGGA